VTCPRAHPEIQHVLTREMLALALHYLCVIFNFVLEGVCLPTRRRKRLEDDVTVDRVEVPLAMDENTGHVHADLPDHAGAGGVPVYEEVGVDSPREGYRRVVEGRIACRECHPIQSEHPESEVMVVLPISVSTVFLGLADPQSPSQRLGFSRARKT
jgi:hypothetical protein